MEALREALGPEPSDWALQVLLARHGDVERAVEAFFDEGPPLEPPPAAAAASEALPAPAPAAAAAAAPAAAASAPVAGSEAEAWACPTCTLVNAADDSTCAACGQIKPGFVAVLCDYAPTEAAVQALAGTAAGFEVGPDELRPTRGTKSFAHLPNGDCLPHALGLGTQYLLSRKVGKSEEHVTLAAQMRSLLHSHMERNWLRTCAVAGDGLRWCESASTSTSTAAATAAATAATAAATAAAARASPSPTATHLLPACVRHALVTLAHNSAVTDLERAQHAAWGSDPDEQKARWRAERGSFYCGMPELLAYAELCHEAGVAVSLRVWRQVAGQLQLMARVPELLPGLEQLVVLDVQLTGEMDSAAAHYKLLQSGSLKGGEPRKAEPKKRKR